MRTGFVVVKGIDLIEIVAEVKIVFALAAEQTGSVVVVRTVFAAEGPAE